MPEEKHHYRKTDVDTFPLLEKFEQRIPRHFSKKSKKPGSIAKEIEGGSSFKSAKLAKGQLISKCPFGVIIWTKIPKKNLTNFCPRI